MQINATHPRLSSLRTAVLTLTLLAIPFYGGAMSQGIQSGIRLCATTVIPAVFPFMILSSMMLGYGVFEEMSFLSTAFEHLFHVGKNGLCAYLCGIFCGFPLGAKCAAEALEHGYISRDECERLVIFSSNPSPAFLICGVGGLFGSVKKGVLLYALTLLSGALIGILIGKGKRATQKKKAHPTLHFSITEAVENAGLNTLYICSYLLLFSALIGILRVLIANVHLLALLLPFLEIGASCAFLTGAPIASVLALLLCAFSSAFGGICVHLQCAHVLRKTGVCMKKILFFKLLQGLLAAALCAFFSIMI